MGVNAQTPHSYVSKDYQLCLFHSFVQILIILLKFHYNWVILTKLVAEIPGKI